MKRLPPATLADPDHPQLDAYAVAHLIPESKYSHWVPVMRFAAVEGRAPSPSHPGWPCVRSDVEADLTIESD